MRIRNPELALYELQWGWTSQQCIEGHLFTLSPLGNYLCGVGSLVKMHSQDSYYLPWSTNSGTEFTLDFTPVPVWAVLASGTGSIFQASPGPYWPSDATRGRSRSDRTTDGAERATGPVRVHNGPLRRARAGPLMARHVRVYPTVAVWLVSR